MEAHSGSASEAQRRAVETFWESFPPFWQRIQAHIRQVSTEQFDISVEQFHILRHIRLGHASVSELAKAKNISRPAVSQALNALVDKGLVSRTPNTQDRRYIQLDLTPSGDAMLDDVIQDTRQWMVEILACLSDEELHTLIQGMQLLKKTQPAFHGEAN